MEDQSQSRRTNILVGDEILTQIADSPYISHENGVMTINLSNQPNPATIGNITITALRDGKGDHLLVKGWNLDAEIATLQDIYDLAALKTDLTNYATKTDLTNYATKTDPAGVAVTWESLTGKPDVFPASPHVNQRFFLHFPFNGTLSVGQSAVGLLPAPIYAGARLITITALMIDPFTTGTVRFSVHVARPANGTGWQACTSTPSPIYQEASSQPYGLFYAPTLDGFALPAGDFSDGLVMAGDMFKVTVEDTCQNAADAVVVFEFYPNFEDFSEARYGRE